MKKIKFSILVFLIIILCYISNITNFPDSIILFEGEKLNLKTSFGVQVCSNTLSSPGKYLAEVNILGKIPVKEVSVNVISNTYVIPIGNNIGLKIYTNGVLVVGMGEIYTNDNKVYKPYENSGIEEGDMIVQVNGNFVTCTSDLTNIVNKTKGENLNIKYSRNGQEYDTNISAIKINENDYKLGLWVRDGTAGVGTISFYEPSTRIICSIRTWCYGCGYRTIIKNINRRSIINQYSVDCKRRKG